MVYLRAWWHDSRSLSPYHVLSYKVQVLRTIIVQVGSTQNAITKTRKHALCGLDYRKKKKKKEKNEKKIKKKKKIKKGKKMKKLKKKRRRATHPILATNTLAQTPFIQNIGISDIQPREWGL